MLLKPRHLAEKNGGTIADGVLEWLAERLVSLELRPGQWVTEQEVAERLGVSRQPVREAFRELARDGIVEPRRRRGTMIVELDAATLESIYQARALVDGEMFSQAVEHMNDADAVRLAAIADELARSLDDRTAFFHGTVDLWQTMMDICPSPVIRELSASLWRRSLPVRGIGFTTAEPVQASVRYITQIAELAKLGDADGVRTTTAEMLIEGSRAILSYVFIDVGEGVRIVRPRLAAPRHSS